MTGPMVYRRLRAPSADGDVLLDPPPEKIATLITGNIALRETACIDLGGRTLRELATAARDELRGAAKLYTSRYVELSSALRRDATDRIYLVGHQPELFHPGVWVKNFVLDALAKRDNAIAVHVLIDNDEAQSSSIRVPTGTLAEPRIETVAYDEAAAPCAWEERQVCDIATLRSFGERVATTIAPLVGDSIVVRLWRDVEMVLHSTKNLGRALAQLRHRLEIAWGVETLEVPFSTLVDSPAFRYFTAYILCELPRFHAAHNAALAEYRQVHKLRSASQPLPDLASRGGELEAPFWIWNRLDSTRRRLWVERRGEAMRLSDGNAYAWEIPHASTVTSIAAKLEMMNAEGFKVRPRALVTTMMLRLLASDLFIHGIGGAKYDQVTDRIIQDLFDVQPPGFLTATGTRLLSLPHTNVAAGDMQQIDKLLRELRFKPENHLNVAGQPASERSRIEQLIAEKQRWLRQEVATHQLAERHAALSEINAALENYVSSRRDELTAERLRIEAELKRQAILSSREFSFCLYPAETLRAWLLDAATAAV